MNFVTYHIYRKKPFKPVGGGFLFTKQPRPNKISKKVEYEFVRSAGYDPKHYLVSFCHYKSLKKLMKSYFNSLLGI